MVLRQKCKRHNNNDSFTKREYNKTVNYNPGKSKKENKLSLGQGCPLEHTVQWSDTQTLKLHHSCIRGPDRTQTRTWLGQIEIQGAKFSLL